MTTNTTTQLIESIIEQAESRRIDLTTPYDTWVRIGFAIASEFGAGGGTYFHRLSVINEHYNYNDCERKWQHLLKTSNGSIKIGTLIQYAKNAGIEVAQPKSLGKYSSQQQLITPPSPAQAQPLNIALVTYFRGLSDNYYMFLRQFYGMEDMAPVWHLYGVGHIDSATVYWTIGTDAQLRWGNVVEHDEEGNRISATTWHDRAKLRTASEVRPHVLFGEHLLAFFPRKPVAVVEREEDALLCAIARPDTIWLAVGDDTLTIEAISRLRRSSVYLYPRANNQASWSAIAASYNTKADENIVKIVETETYISDGIIAKCKAELQAWIDYCEHYPTSSIEKQITEVEELSEDERILKDIIALNPAIQIIIDGLQLEILNDCHIP